MKEKMRTYNLDQHSGDEGKFYLTEDLLHCISIELASTIAKRSCRCAQKISLAHHFM